VLSTFDRPGTMHHRASLLRATLTLVALPLGVVGCGPDGPDVVGGQIVDVGNTDDVVVRPGDSVRIAMTEFAFDPDDINAEPGEYNGEVVNEGAVLHNLTFADGTSFPVPPGESATIEFTVPDGGLTFICSVEGHEAAGMRGEIHTTETDELD
jgi:plastocyanin